APRRQQRQCNRHSPSGRDERLRTGATSWLAGLPFHDRFVLGFGHTVTVDKQRGCYLGGEGA
ncbi:hypothetical protein, partial [Pseudomonas aeruginosa]|uniref:hypothetical protein n=1 Tax=Pseudomonas aeruginosa TaxID=287 RepID=UPI0010479BF3